MPVLTRRPAAEAPRQEAPRPDPDSIREAVRGTTTRRTVVRSGAWSVPVVAVAIAAPAFAASTTVCSACFAGAPVRCTVNVVVGGSPTTGPCQCGSGLVCATAGVGPLNLVNVCVAAVPSLTSTTCGSGQCFGVCVAAGGAVVTAVNALAGLVRGVSVLGCNVGTTGALPTNICAVPALPPNDPAFGRFGTLCIVNAGTGLLGTAIGALLPVNGLIGGLAFATRCASPYSCKPGVSATTSGTCLPGVVGTADLTIGFCQC